MFYKNQCFAFFDFDTTGVKANGLDTDDCPIELDIILTDEHLLMKKIFHSYILWDWMEPHKTWPKKHQYYAHHKRHDISTL